MSEALTHCRLCGEDATSFSLALDLGIQVMTGVFPGSAAEDATLERGPVMLVRCLQCGLVQLSETFSLPDMYGDNYGYRSGLNQSMVKHLRQKARQLEASGPADVVVDIGSNDGTLLNSYLSPSLVRIGFDPTARKFAQYYATGILRVDDFFSEAKYRAVLGTRQTDIVTSVACLYDLPSPQTFVNDVAAILSERGVWHFEQSYLPSMLTANAYDAVCHEHIEYYGLRQLRAMCVAAGLTIVDVVFNDINGGSIALTAAKHGTEHAAVAPLVEMEIHAIQRALGDFANRVDSHRRAFRRKLVDLRAAGKVVCGLGASTKGNVLLQACGIGPDLIAAIGEVNPDKFGKMTPGTRIPIVSEADLAKMKPDVCVVLPWHFRESFLKRRRAGDPALLFPLPNIEVVE